LKVCPLDMSLINGKEEGSLSHVLKSGQKVKTNYKRPIPSTGKETRILSKKNKNL